jgi:hypothetical protein
MYFPRPASAFPARGQAQPIPQQAPPQMPQAPVNTPGIPNPATHQQNQYAPIPPDEVKRWAEVNHTSKGSVKQVEWSNNADKYVFQMKDGTSETVSPEYIMQNKGHWQPSPVHEQSVIRHIIGKQVQKMPPQMLAQMGQGQPQVPGPQAPPVMGAQAGPAQATPQPMMPG